MRIAVTDTGAGVAPDTLEGIFEPFSRADVSTTREHSGLGLGFAITRHSVELHGGRIEASSAEKGHGATFTVWLPPVAQAPVPTSG